MHVYIYLYISVHVRKKQKQKTETKSGITIKLITNIRSVIIHIVHLKSEKS